jgi:hypothetical protein
MNKTLFGTLSAVALLALAACTSSAGDDGEGGSGNEGGDSSGGSGGTGNVGGATGGTGNVGGGAACLGCGEWIDDTTGADLCTESFDIVDALNACYCDAGVCGTECADSDLCGGADPQSNDCAMCQSDANAAGCTVEWNECANDLGS